MSVKNAVLLILCACLMLCSCSSAKKEYAALRTVISEDYVCTVNVFDLSGGMLFGGNLKRSGGEYAFSLSYPSDVSGVEIDISENGAFGKIGGLTVPLTSSLISRLTELCDCFDTALASEPEGIYGAELYGKSVCNLQWNGFCIFCDGGIPLYAESGSQKAEITGFSQS